MTATANDKAHVLGRLRGFHAARQIVELVRTHWPDIDPRFAAAREQEGAETTWAVVADVTRLKPFEPLAEVTRYVEGCIEALALYGHATNVPEIPF